MIDDATTPYAPTQPMRRPTVAIALGFLWPGLGQWYIGRPRAALAFGAPVALLALLIVARAWAGLATFAALFLDPTVALTAFLLVIALGAWRLVAMADGAGVTSRRQLTRGRLGFVFATFTAAILATHGLVAVATWSLYDTASHVFVGNPNPTASPDPSATPEPTDLAAATPFATPETSTSRITVLLTGIDKTVSRDHSLTDTLLVVSLDPVTHKVSMVSFPRDIAEFPLYGGGTYSGKINSLMTYAQQHPDQFPDGPLPTLAKELSFLLGIPIHYFAAIDLDGFRRMIDEVGGVTVTVDRAINDAHYDWLDGSTRGFYLKAGTQTLDGRTALAFVRSRYGAGDNDFTRAARQQQLLVALRTKLVDPAMLTRLPGILGVLKDTVRTNFPPDQIDDLVGAAQQVADDDISRVVLRPPTYSVHPPTNTTGGTYILRINLEAVRQLSVTWFGEDSRFWTGTYTPDGSPIPAAP